MRIVAFDLNDTLTTPEGLQFYKEQEAREDTIVGILTANVVFRAKKFAEDEDLNPEFIRRGFLKAPELIFIKIRGADEHIYVGNRVTDELAANLAGWRYIDVDELS